MIVTAQGRVHLVLVGRLTPSVGSLSDLEKVTTPRLSDGIRFLRAYSAAWESRRICLCSDDIKDPERRQGDDVNAKVAAGSPELDPIQMNRRILIGRVQLVDFQAHAQDILYWCIQVDLDN